MLVATANSSLALPQFHIRHFGEWQKNGVVLSLLFIAFLLVALTKSPFKALPSWSVKDDLNRLTNLTQAKASVTQASYEYTLRADGLRTNLLEADGRNSHWDYDTLYRVTQESITGAPVSGVTNFTYDAVNRLSRNSSIAGIINYSITADSNDHRSDQAYNPNGAVTGAGGHTFDFDAEDRLTGMDTAGPNAVGVVYDGDGNLVQKTVGGHTYTYLIDTNNPTGYAQIAEIRKNGVLTDVFNYGPNGIISQSSIANGTRYFGKDGSNNTRFLTDTSGAVTDSFDYSVDGILIGRTGSFPAVHLFQGEYFDADLGLYWLRARWMNPQVGGFMSMDTFNGNASDPASLHKYAYTGWDGGINRTDPSGHDFFSLPSLSMAVSIQGVLHASALVMFGGAVGALGGAAVSAGEAYFGGHKDDVAFNAAEGAIQGFKFGFLTGGFAGSAFMMKALAAASIAYGIPKVIEAFQDENYGLAK